MTVRQGTKPAAGPGAVLKAELAHRGWSQGDLAKQLGVSQAWVSGLVNSTRALTARQALRLEAVLGEPAEYWMDLQRDHDLASLRRSMAVELRALRRRQARDQATLIADLYAEPVPWL